MEPQTGHRCSDRSSWFPAPCSIQPPNQRLVMLGQRPGVARPCATGDRCHRDCHSRRAPACNRAQLSATSATNAREGKSLRRRAMRANERRVLKILVSAVQSRPCPPFFTATQRELLDCPEGATGSDEAALAFRDVEYLTEVDQ